MPIQAMEIWNEPYQFNFWLPKPDPSAYGELVKVASRAIKEANKSVKVLAAGDELEYDLEGQQPWASRLTGLTQILPSTSMRGRFVLFGPRECGTVDHSPSGPRLRDVWPYQACSRSSGQAARETPHLVTEVGWCTATVCGTSEAERAGYLTTLLTYVANGPSEIEQLFLYTWNRQSGTDREGTFGLRQSDGRPTQAWSSIADLLRY